ncbi:MAG: molybdopterin dinucleotide binding domain-containing protein, partial [Thermoanaerobaculia bacterium]|nr:molybdopterin dinucleotide binding domain-containing protein [Thermoanaerobaculia bacterium]
LGLALGATGPVLIEPPEAEVERSAMARLLGLSGVAEPAARGAAAARGPLPGYDIAGSDYVLSIGNAFLDRGHQPVHGTWAMSRVRAARAGRRGKLVQAESRMSQTAAFADEWIPVRPGTEAVLARAIAHEVAVAGLARSGVDGGTEVSEPSLWVRLLGDPAAGPSAEEAAADCDVPAEQIRRVARELGHAEAPVVLGGGSAAFGPDGEHATLAALALNALFPRASAPLGGLRALPAERTGLLDDPGVLRSSGAAERDGLPAGATCLVVETDPLHTRPAARGWGEALGGAAAIVCLSSFLDDTTRLADVILPLHSDIERFVAAAPEGLDRIAVSAASPAVRPLYDTRHPGDILLALGVALGHAEALPWQDFEAAATAGFAARHGEGGASLARAADAGSFVASPAELPPTWDVQRYEPGPPAGGAGDGELVLLLFESAKYGDGRGANKPWLQELPDTLTTFMWSSWAEVSVAGAASLHLETGDLVEVASARGSITVPVAVRPEARPGTVAIPLGGGYRDYGRYARGRGDNPLDLVGDETVAGTAAPALVGAGVTLRRLGPGQVAIYGRGLRDAEHIPTGWAPMDSGGTHG